MKCKVCNRIKKLIEQENGEGLCDWDCDGYGLRPYPHYDWFDAVKAGLKE